MWGIVAIIAGLAVLECVRQYIEVKNLELDRHD